MATLIVSDSNLVLAGHPLKWLDRQRLIFTECLHKGPKEQALRMDRVWRSWVEGTWAGEATKGC